MCGFKAQEKTGCENTAEEEFGDTLGKSIARAVSLG